MTITAKVSQLLASLGHRFVRTSRCGRDTDPDGINVVTASLGGDYINMKTK